MSKLVTGMPELIRHARKEVAVPDHGGSIDFDPKQDVRTWRERLESLQIQADSGLQQLVFNGAQDIFWDVVWDLWERGQPIWVIIGKPRQVGISTEAEALIYDGIKMNPNSRAITVGHKFESSDNMFRIFNRFYDNENTQDVPPKSTSSRKELQFASPHNGLITIVSSKDVAVGVSGTYQYAHFTEISLWEDPETAMAAFTPSIPYKPNSIFILESVLYERARNTWFEYFWNQTVQGKTNFTEVFIPWHELEEYELAVEGPEVLEPYSEYEDWGRRTFAWSDSKINWRRHTQRNFISESPSKADIDFKKTYPSIPEEMFLKSSVNSPFNNEILTEFLNEALTRNVWSGHFVADPEDPNCLETPPKLSVTEGEGHGLWSIFEPVQDDREYTIAADTGAGLEDGDFSAASVIKVGSPMQEVATLKCKLDIGDFSGELVKAGMYYNEALMGIEYNGVGQGTFDQVANYFHYSNVYRRRGKSQKVGLSTPRDGWITTDEIKATMVSHWWRHVSEGLLEVSPETIREALTFMVDEKGKYHHRPGCFDDLLIACMIALQMVEMLPETEMTRDDAREFVPKRHKAPWDQEDDLYHGRGVTGY